jgi:hypothetical protein
MPNIKYNFKILKEQSQGFFFLLTKLFLCNSLETFTNMLALVKAAGVLGLFCMYIFLFV